MANPRYIRTAFRVLTFISVLTTSLIKILDEMGRLGLIDRR